VDEGESLNQSAGDGEVELLAEAPAKIGKEFCAPEEEIGPETATSKTGIQLWQVVLLLMLVAAVSVVGTVVALIALKVMDSSAFFQAIEKLFSR
jgi:hypothetical protein